MSLIVPFFSPLLFLSSLSLCLSHCCLLLFSSCHTVCPVYGHVLLICSILPIPLGFIAHIGCCVQKTNGSVSSGPGKELQRYRLTDTHTCIFFTRHAVVHVSVIVLVGHPPPPSSPLLSPHLLTTPHSHYLLLHCHVLYKLCVDVLVWIVLKCFFPAFGVLFYNHSTQRLTKMFQHLWVDPLQLSCPEDQGSDSWFLPACVLVYVFTPLPLCTLFRDWDSSHVTVTHLWDTSHKLSDRNFIKCTVWRWPLHASTK